MKAEIHPDYRTTRIVCACGRVTETRGTVDEYHVEICSHCHPFFTGKQKLVDTAGRVERFLAKYSDSEEEAERLAEEAQERAASTEKLEAEPTEEELEDEEGLEAEASEGPAAEAETPDASQDPSQADAGEEEPARTAPE